MSSSFTAAAGAASRFTTLPAVSIPSHGISRRVGGGGGGGGRVTVERIKVQKAVGKRRFGRMSWSG